MIFFSLSCFCCIGIYRKWSRARVELSFGFKKVLVKVVALPCCPKNLVPPAVHFVFFNQPLGALHSKCWCKYQYPSQLHDTAAHWLKQMHGISTHPPSPCPPVEFVWQNFSKKIVKPQNLGKFYLILVILSQKTDPNQKYWISIARCKIFLRPGLKYFFILVVGNP